MLDRERVDDMFLGNLHQSNVIILLRLFFGAVGVGFAFINETQYALVSLIIAAIIGIFTYRLGATFETDEAQASFALELDVLADMVVYGLLPSALLVQLTSQSVVGVFIMALYLLAVAIRSAHFNRSERFLGELPENAYNGLPLQTSAIVLPVISLLGYLIDLSIFQYIWGIVMIALAVGYVVTYPVPKLPNKYILPLAGVGILVVILIIFLGSLITIPTA